MNETFRVYVANGDNSGLEVELPVTDHQMLDIMDKLRLAPGELPYLEILDYHDFDYLDKCMPCLGNLYELNALAGRLAEMEPPDLAAFEGLVGMELQKKVEEVQISKLIDFAHSVDCCHVVPDAMTDYELGKFYAEYGFVPEVEDLSDAAFELLDFGKIGKDYRESEEGVFTSWGYVVRSGDLKQVAESMDYLPHKPDYIFRLTLINTCSERGERNVPLELPTTDEQLEAALERLDSSDWTGIAMTSLDGPLTGMDRDLFYMDELPKLNELAKSIRQIDKGGRLPQYKAILCAVDCHDIDTALALADTVDEYHFRPDIRTPEQVAMEDLRVTVGTRERELLVKHLNLHAYGRDLLARYNEKLTEYGMLERKDGQPIQSMTDQPKMGGMEMN